MSQQLDLFDADTSRAHRDAGIKIVMGHHPGFSEQFAKFIEALPFGWIGTCEDIRRDWMGIMPHPNAWGACWREAKRQGHLIELAEQVAMTGVKSHARKTHLHRKV